MSRSCNCGTTLVYKRERVSGCCLRCLPAPQPEPVEGPMGDPEHGGSPPPGAPVVDQRADTIPAAPPTEPMTDCEDEP